MNENSTPALQGGWFNYQAFSAAHGRHLLSGLERPLSVFLGCVLLYSGIQHLGNTFQFLSSVFQYQIVPPLLGKLVAVGLPFVQIAIAVSLIGRVWLKAGLLAACGILLMFAIGQCLALGRGLEIPCGCFGTSKYEPVDAWTVARTVGLLGMAVLALTARRNQSRASRIDSELRQTEK